MTSATVHGPSGNSGVAGVLTDSTEDTEDEDDMLLMDGPRWWVGGGGAGRRGAGDMCREVGDVALGADLHF